MGVTWRQVMGKMMIMSVFGVEVDRDGETREERERRSKKERKENLKKAKRKRGNWRRTDRGEGKRWKGSLKEQAELWGSEAGHSRAKD